MPRLEIKTARRIHLGRAVSRLASASYANREAQLSQFKQATLFRLRRRAIARTYCRIGSCGVQIQLPLSAFVSLVRVLIEELPVRTTLPSVANSFVAEGFIFSGRSAHRHELRRLSALRGPENADSAISVWLAVGSVTRNWFEAFA